MRLAVERAGGAVTAVDVADGATAATAAVVVACALGYGALDEPWRVGIPARPNGVYWLRLEQTVEELDGPDVFLTVEPEGIGQWN